MANKSNLFFNMSEKEIERFLKDSDSFVKNFKSGEYIFNQGDRPEYTFIIEKGSVVVENIDSNGKKNIVNVFNSTGTVFGEVYMYLESESYDYSSYSNEDSKILCIPKKALLLSRNDDLNLKIINNMLKILAGKSFFLNQKLLMMGAATLREKLIKYILNHSEEDELVLTLTRQEMGNYLGVPRPSVSRELMNMKKENLIEIDKNKIIFNREKLENLI
ncbi:MAG: Crp/Fnr family transcriptional regulator [Peptoniphilus sp.]|uniref:Crp/Fnr family transcriptional regulator n=1 Tax=Peptoniphilus sp. TaxID=1971214 RepID=UPI002A765667|nr:Crp/Fnr family transcriptional regulator [Peptoniphilus sp.]MDY2986499.1 Crp/Fnr family transcriptional regulator [Peptoniphilus sp.]